MLEHVSADFEFTDVKLVALHVGAIGKLIVAGANVIFGGERAGPQEHREHVFRQGNVGRSAVERKLKGQDAINEKRPLYTPFASTSAIRRGPRPEPRERLRGAAPRLSRQILPKQYRRACPPKIQR
jgi:hypothetical protein